VTLDKVGHIPIRHICGLACRCGAYWIIQRLHEHISYWLIRIELLILGGFYWQNVFSMQVYTACQAIDTCTCCFVSYRPSLHVGYVDSLKQYIRNENDSVLHFASCYFFIIWQLPPTTAAVSHSHHRLIRTKVKQMFFLQESTCQKVWKGSPDLLVNDEDCITIML